MVVAFCFYDYSQSSSYMLFDYSIWSLSVLFLSGRIVVVGQILVILLFHVLFLL